MGKHKYIKSPDQMWDLFLEYRKETKANPLRIHDFKGSLANEVFIEKERPLTDKGFYNFCRRKIGCVKQYFDNQDKLYNDYITICTHIKEEIDQDQIEGGMAGIYNPSITQRLNNLTERTDITTDGKDLNTSIKVEIVKPNEGNDCI